MAQWLRGLAAFPEDPASISSTHMAAHNHLELQEILWLPQALGTRRIGMCVCVCVCVRMYVCMNMYVHMCMLLSVRGVELRNNFKMFDLSNGEIVDKFDDMGKILKV